MSTVGILRLPATDVALAELFRQAPAVVVESLPVASHRADHVWPLLEVRGGVREFAAVERSLQADPSVVDVDRCGIYRDAQSYRRYHVDWTADCRHTVRTLVAGDGIIERALGTDGHWDITMLVKDRTTLSRTYERCRDRGLDVDLRTISDPELTQQDGARFGLSAAQAEALRAATRHDYYSIPRQVRLQELAAAIGISHQALSERLRRGHQTLIDQTLMNDGLDGGLSGAPTLGRPVSEASR